MTTPTESPELSSLTQSTTTQDSVEHEHATSQAMPYEHPNVLVFLTDDQGPWAMSATMPELVTPTIDHLVAQSTTFENFYCASPVCSPARASLITGRMPSAHGVHDWLVGERHPDATEDVYLGGLTNLPETLSHHGYTCGMAGKWHVGTSRFAAPGFDYWYAHRLGGGPYYNAPIWDENGNKYEEPRYFTYAVAEEASRFLDDIAQKSGKSPFGSGECTAGVNANTGSNGKDDTQKLEDARTLSNNATNTVHNTKPFYLQVNFTAPHDPWINNHPQDLYDLYKDCSFNSIPREEPHEWVQPRRDDFKEAFANPLPYLQGYAAALSGVDRAVQMILDRLKINGFADNTIIVYMADNGFSCGHHGYWGKGNGTYPMNFWDQSVRVPFVIHQIGQTQAATVTHQVSATSFFETICDLTGVPIPEDPLRAGHSVANLLDDPTSNCADEAVMVFEEYGGGRMVRSGDWKLVERYNGPCELYNLSNDPHERENRYNDTTTPHIASVQKELHDRLTEWFAAHETATERAFDRDIRGRGQIQPPRKGLADNKTYIQQAVTFDGTRA